MNESHDNLTEQAADAARRSSGNLSGPRGLAALCVVARKRGKRRVIDYLLSPIEKAAKESLGER